jgi:predicted nucleotidyltransferase
MSRVEAPAAVREQLDKLTRDLREALADELVGVYLHGSLVLGCFNPQRSDIDVIGVTRRAITSEERNALGVLMLRSSGQKERPRQAPYPLEMTLLTEEQLRPWRYPTPFDFHYGESQRRRFTAGEFNPLWAEDYDLAAHVTVLREAGVTLLGPPVREAFPLVPEHQYVDSLLRDFGWSREATGSLRDPQCFQDLGDARGAHPAFEAQRRPLGVAMRSAPIPRTDLKSGGRLPGRE